MNTKRPKKRGAGARRPPASRAKKYGRNTLFSDVDFSVAEYRVIVKSIARANDTPEDTVRKVLENATLGNVLSNNPGDDAEKIIKRYLEIDDEPIVTTTEPEKKESEKKAPETMTGARPKEKREIIRDIRDLGVRAVTIKSDQLDYVKQFSTIESNNNVRFWRTEEAARKYAQDLDGKVKLVQHTRIYDSSTPDREEHEATDTVLGYYDDITRGRKVERVYFEYDDSEIRFREVASFAKKKVKPKAKKPVKNIVRKI